jgi:4-hydroxybenzoate polyprenyltransferase
MTALTQQLRGLIESARLALSPTLLTNASVVACIAFCGQAQGSLSAYLVTVCYGLGCYLYGMWGNDRADSAWDAVHCPKRPVPQGRVSLTALQIAMGVAVLGVFFLGHVLTNTGLDPLYTLVLLLVIFAYNVVHHRWTGLGILLMGACRGVWVWTAYHLIVAQCSTGSGGVDGTGCVPALAYAISLGFYTMICTWVASGEAHNPQRKKWAGRLLAGISLHDAVWLAYFATAALMSPDGASASVILLPLFAIVCFVLIRFLSRRGHRVT